MLELRSQYLETMPDGSPKGLRVILGNDEGAMYPVLLPVSYQSHTLQEIQEAARTVMYDTEFPNRAENEKFHEISEKIAKYDELIEKSQKAIKELEQATEASQLATAQNKETVDAAVSELTALVMSLVNNVSFDEETDSEVVED